MSEALRCSIVLPTYNRQSCIIDCLRSLERQTLSPAVFEVIVVDDGSTDGTEQVVQHYIPETKLAVRYIRQQHAGPGAARNFGVQHARAELIAFLEDDVVADSRWLECALSRFSSGDIAGLEGVTLLEGSSAPVRVFDASEYLSFIPCNLFLRKETFLRCGGYDTDFFDKHTNLYFREDAEFGYRLLEHGERLVRADDVVVYHPQLFTTAGECLRHARRFLFDPLLYKKRPLSFRKYLEVKKLGRYTVRRPFHYLTMFYILLFLLILTSVALGWQLFAVSGCVLLVMQLFPLWYRYQRSWFPNVARPGVAVIIIVVPFYYWYWFLRGCWRFRSWGSLL